jgi:hypothetical protein
MWDPRRLTTLWTSAACSGVALPFFYQKDERVLRGNLQHRRLKKILPSPLKCSATHNLTPFSLLSLSLFEDQGFSFFWSDPYPSTCLANMTFSGNLVPFNVALKIISGSLYFLSESDKSYTFLYRCVIKTHYLFSRTSRDKAIGMTTGWTTGVRFPAEARYFSLLNSVQTRTGAHPASFTLNSCAASSVRETNHSPPSSAEVNNGDILSLPPYVFMAWRLIS